MPIKTIRKNLPLENLKKEVSLFSLEHRSYKILYSTKFLEWARKEESYTAIFLKKGVVVLDPGLPPCTPTKLLEVLALHCIPLASFDDLIESETFAVTLISTDS